MSPKPYVTILSALGVAIGVALVILSAVLDKSYYAFLALIPLVLLPFPAILCSPKDDFQEETFLEMCGHFLTGFLLASLIGTLVVMFRVDSITGQSLGLCITGLVIMAGSVMWYAKASAAPSY